MLRLGWNLECSCLSLLEGLDDRGTSPLLAVDGFVVSGMEMALSGPLRMSFGCVPAWC